MVEKTEDIGRRAISSLRPDGAAWDYFPHEQACSRAYRWGEDGIAGISDKPKLGVKSE